MSDISISYKGNTIATMDASGTKTLLTSGKYCEDDITLQYVKPSGTWNWMGKNPTLVKTLTETVALKDTDFDTWTPSTTAKVILASADFGTFEADMANYDYMVKWTFDTNLSYLAGATLAVMPIKQMAIAAQSLNRRPSNYQSLVGKTLNQNYYYSLIGIPACIYYNGSGAIAYASQGSYGFYIAQVNPAYSNNFADTPTVTLKRPTVSARCDTTYMATARAAEIDKNSTLTIKCEVYRVDKPAMVETIFNELMDMYEE